LDFLNKEIRITSGVASVVQGALLLFFIPFLAFLIYLVLRNPSKNGFLFLSGTSVVAFVILRMAMASGDVIMGDDYILVEKLFKSEIKPLEDYESVNSTAFPLFFCLKFKGGSRVFFSLKNSDLFRHLWNSDPNDILKELKAKFER
jgi:hypothetical protein